MRVEDKKYTLWDYIRINWSISRFLGCVRITDKLIRAALRRCRFWRRPPLSIPLSPSFMGRGKAGLCSFRCC